MNPSESIDYLQRILSLGPAGIHEWFQAVRQGEERVPEEFNWLGLAEATAHRARIRCDLEWAKVAIELYEELAHSAGGREADALMLASMHLRAFFITRCGVAPNHPLFNFQDLVSWFLNSTPIPLDQIKVRAAAWEKLDIEEIRTLRDIKNRLAVFEGLDRLGLVDASPKIKDWLSIRNQLP